MRLFGFNLPSRLKDNRHLYGSDRVKWKKEDAFIYNKPAGRVTKKVCMHQFCSYTVFCAYRLPGWGFFPQSKGI